MLATDNAENSEWPGIRRETNVEKLSSLRLFVLNFSNADIVFNAKWHVRKEPPTGIVKEIAFVTHKIHTRQPNPLFLIHCTSYGIDCVFIARIWYPLCHIRLLF